MMKKMMEVIPKSDYRLRQIVLVAKRAQARSAQQETSAGLGFKPQPSRGQYPQNVPARKDHHVALDLAHAVNHPIGPHSNLVGDSPPGQPSRNSSQSGRLAWISARRPSYSP
jgi:hypothetical protein